jgi:hypothetical protein
MDEHLVASITSVLLAVTGIAVIAVLVSNHAQTGSVLGAGGSTLGNMIRCAISPITGDACGTSVNSTIRFNL